MSSHSPNSDSAAPIRFDSGLARSLAHRFLIPGVLLLIISGVGAISNPVQFAHSWLYSFLFFFTVCCGSLFWTMIHHATNAGWSTLIRRQAENLANLLPVMAGLFIPLIFMGSALYPWMRPEVVAHDHVLHEKAGYLNIPFFYFRAVLFFTALIALARFFRGRSVLQDQDGSIVHSRQMQQRVYVCCVLFGVSVTFSAFDWIMSLDHHWASTMFGVTIFAGGAYAAMAVLILVVLWLKSLGYLGLVNEEHYHLMTKILFSFACFWGWVAFAQYMLYWYANIPEETIFFVERNVGSWFWVSLSIITFKFAIPFLGLLMQFLKRKPVWIGLMAGSVLLGQAIDLYWHVLPRLHCAGWTPHWLDLVIWLGMACVLAAFYMRQLASAATYPVRDPRLQESVECAN